MNLYKNELLGAKGERISIDGDQLHHFRNVLRGKIGEEVKVFNGNGSVVNGIVESVSKKEIVILINSFLETQTYSTIDELTIGVPKKEYLESIMRTATQAGVKKVNLVQTQYSPWVYKEYSRLGKILISAILQSENPFLPEIEVYSCLKDFLKLKKETILFSTELENVTAISSIKGNFQNIFIGPEGGFHETELELFSSESNITCVRIGAPIMKAETAVSYCLGLTSFFKEE